MPKTSARNTIPATVKDLYDQVVAQTAEFCAEYLTEEYSGPCRELTGFLARKRPSPLLGGRLELWSCAVIYTVAKVNFLFDHRSTPSIAGYRLCEIFHTSPTTIALRVRDITRMFRILMMDPRFTPAGRQAPSVTAIVRVALQTHRRRRRAARL